jgi:hypothetical protein
VKLFDWPFFFLLFATGWASFCAMKLKQVYQSREHAIWLQPMAWGPKVELIITLINIPVYWSNPPVLTFSSCPDTLF